MSTAATLLSITQLIKLLVELRAGYEAGRLTSVELVARYQAIGADLQRIDAEWEALESAAAAPPAGQLGPG